MTSLAVSGENIRDLALVTVLAVAPLAIVCLTALFRGYTIHITMFRPRGGRRGRGDYGDD
jgi:hypothetical protein